MGEENTTEDSITTGWAQPTCDKPKTRLPSNQARRAAVFKKCVNMNVPLKSGGKTPFACTCSAPARRLVHKHRVSMV